MKKLLIIDTFNFLHRAYHALPKTFTDPNGEPINAVYGVASMLITTFDLIQPDYAIAAMDSKEPTFRVEEFTGYKAHRRPMEDDLSSQVPKVLELVKSFGISTVQVSGYEADDIIGTLVKKFSQKNELVIVSNDRDLWQLVSSNVIFMLPSSGKITDWVGHKEAQSRLGFDPHMLPDYKGLRGDPGDNIPGVYGIGDKMAKSLLVKFGSLENIFKNIDKVEQNSLKEKLLENYEIAIQSKRLGQIVEDVPFDVSLDDCKYKGFNKVAVLSILEKYNFKSLIKRLGFNYSEINKKIGNSTEGVVESQLPLL